MARVFLSIEMNFQCLSLMPESAPGPVPLAICTGPMPGFRLLLAWPTWLLAPLSGIFRSAFQTDQHQ